MLVDVVAALVVVKWRTAYITQEIIMHDLSMQILLLHRYILINVVAVDDLVTQVTRASTAMVLSYVSHGFLTPAPVWLTDTNICHHFTDVWVPHAYFFQSGRHQVCTCTDWYQVGLSLREANLWLNILINIKCGMILWFWEWYYDALTGLMQYCGNFNALAMVLPQSCTELSMLSPYSHSMKIDIEPGPRSSKSIGQHGLGT